MEEKRTLYSKRFLHPTFEDIEKELNENESEVINKSPYKTAEEFFDHLENDSEYVLNPARIKNKLVFINSVVQLSQRFEIDADIIEADVYISASIFLVPSLYAGTLESMIARVFTMADDFSFHNIHDDVGTIAITFTYYTHDRYLSGKKVRELK